MKNNRHMSPGEVHALMCMASWDLTSATASVLLEHYCGHQVVETPNHLNRALLLKTHQRGWTEESERSGSSFQSLNAAGKKENCVIPLLVVNEILSGFTRLGRT